MLAVLVFCVILTPRTNESYPIRDDEEKEKDRDEETTTIMALQYNSYYTCTENIYVVKHCSYSSIYLHHLVIRKQRRKKIE